VVKAHRGGKNGDMKDGLFQVEREEAMKKIMSAETIFLVLVAVSFSIAAEHGGREHGGSSPITKEGGSMQMQMQMPSSVQIHQAMTDYISEMKKTSGSFDVYDSEAGKTRRLELLNIHQRVGKTGNYYYSCADFKDLDSGEKLDLDLDVKESGGTLGVVDVRIHKVDGKERYTYVDKDNRIPVAR
jgi:hypothetical protein